MPGALGRHPGWDGCWGQPEGGTWMRSALVPIGSGLILVVVPLELSPQVLQCARDSGTRAAVPVTTPVPSPMVWVHLPPRKVLWLEPPSPCGCMWVHR